MKMELALQSRASMYLVTFSIDVCEHLVMYFPTCREILMHQCVTYCSFIKQSLSVPG